MALTADDLVTSLADINASSFVTESDRVNTKNALIAALRRVQTPFEIAFDQVWTSNTSTSVIKTLIEAGLWKAWAAQGGGPMAVKELAALVDFDPELLNRLLRELAGQHLLLQINQDTYALTPFSESLAEDKFPSLYSFLYEVIQPCFANFPKFSAETKYQNPVDPSNTNLQHWRGKDETLFTLLNAKPDLRTHFNNSMTLYAAARPPWTDIYPTTDLVTAHASDPKYSSTPLVVDIGGGVGHDLEKFRAKHPSVPHGSLILQDQPDVVSTSTLTSPCEIQAYDFFTPQTVQGANIYYIHGVLHDWPDSKAVQILKNTAAAMTRGYSKILLHELVVASENAHPRATLSDLIMMMIFSAGERSEKQWANIVAQAGLRISKIWSIPESVESILELELA